MNLQTTIVSRIMRLIANGKPPAGPPSAADPKRILVIANGALGDTLLTTPAILSLRKRFPESFIGVLVRHGKEAILRHHPAINRIYTYDGKNHFFKTRRELRNEHFDMAINLDGNDPDTTPLMYFTNAPVRVGYKKSTVMEFLLTHVVERRPKSPHLIDKYLNILSGIAVPVATEESELVLPEKRIADYRRRLESEFGTRGKFIVGLHPGAGFEFKCWPAERYAELADRLSEKFPAVFLILGGLALDERLGAATHASLKKARGFMHRPKELEELLLTIANLDLFVTNDTGPMHAAMTLDIPTVALFSPTTARHLIPKRKTENRVALSKPVTCDPCITKRCRDSKCMRQFTVDEVFEKAAALLSRRTPRP